MALYRVVMTIKCTFILDAESRKAAREKAETLGREKAGYMASEWKATPYKWNDQGEASPSAVDKQTGEIKEDGE